MDIQHVSNNVVDNVFIVDDASTISNGVLTTPSGIFPAPPSGESYMAQSGAGIGWTLSGGVLSAPPPPVQTYTKEQLAAYANVFQWNLAIGGHNVTVGGNTHLFPTDAISLSLMNGKVSRLAQAGAQTSITWQLPAGYVTLTAADFITAAISVADWMQSTFDDLEPVLTAIEAGSITTPVQIESASWPAR